MSEETDIWRTRTSAADQKKKKLIICCLMLLCQNNNWLLFLITDARLIGSKAFWE